MNNPNFTLTNTTSPVGSIIAFAGNIEKYKKEAVETLYVTSPIEAYGWMLCDGSALNSSEYPELFSALGYLYGGSGDTFNLPDLQGQFLRGVGTTSGSVEERTKAPNGDSNGVGSTQKDALQTHQHTYNEPTGATPGDKGPAFAAVINSYTGTPTSESNPSSINVSQYETRPTNTFIYYLIKYTYKLPSYKQE